MAHAILVSSLFGALALACLKVHGQDVCREYDLGAFAAMLTQIEMRVSSLQEKIEIQRKVNEAQAKAILEMKHVAEALAKTNDDTFRTPTVAFALKSAFSNDIVKGDKLKFKTFIENIGGGFDTKTGIFTAPYSGTYLFHTTVCAYKKKWVYVDLVANYKTLATTGIYETEDNGCCSSAMGIVQLLKGQTTWVQGAWNGTEALYVDHRFATPTFAGVLLQKM